MKRLLILFSCCLIPCFVWAQYVPEGVYGRKGGRLTLNGERLSRAEQYDILADVNGIDFSREWRMSSTMEKVGIWLVATGGVALAGGACAYYESSLIGAAGGVMVSSFGALLVGWMVPGLTAGDVLLTGLEYGDAKTQEAREVCNVIMHVGVVLTLAGLPMLLVHDAKMNRIVDACNRNKPRSPQLSFGPTRNGVGLCLAF